VSVEGGTYEIGPHTGALTLHTGRSGVGAMAGHDLAIEVTRWHGKLDIRADRVDSSTVEVLIDASSFEVREGTGSPVPLLAINKSEILRTISRLLKTQKHPEIRFASTAVVPSPGGFVVRGALTVVGRTSPVDLTVDVDGANGDASGTITATVLHSDFGIKPYSAMLGALRVRDAVEVRAEVRLS
jgi:polyisoprenoid-binding protein YceI